MNIADILLISESDVEVPGSILRTLRRGERFYDVEQQYSLSATEAAGRIDAAGHTFVCVYFERDIASVIMIIRSLRLRYEGIAIFVVLPTFADFDEAQAKQRAFSAGATEIIVEHKLDILEKHVGRYIDLFRPRAGRILCVHHDDEFLREYVEVLVQVGYKVDLRGTAEEAWVAYRNNRYDIVVSDDVLKGVDSASNLVANIRRLPGESGGRPIIVILSSNNDTRERVLLELGANEVLREPFDKESMMSKIGAHIANNQRVTAGRFSQGPDAPLMDRATHTLSRQAMSVMWPTYVGMALRYKVNLSVALISVEGVSGLRVRHTNSEVNHALATIAGIIRQNLRAEDCMARWSEDTFAVIIVDCREEIAVSVVLRSIRDAMNTMRLQDKGIALNGGLVGADEFLSAGLESVVAEAQTALTEASSRGAGYVVSYSEIN